MIPDVKPELQELIRNISQKNTYSGNKISESIMRMFEVEETAMNTGILVPFWLPVLQSGRGPRKSTKDYQLYKRIYSWMQKRNMFRSTKTEGRLREAKFITWYINKYGNKQFRNRVFLDIYKTEREKTVTKIMDKFGATIDKITMDVI